MRWIVSHCLPSEVRLPFLVTVTPAAFLRLSRWALNGGSLPLDRPKRADSRPERSQPARQDQLGVCQLSACLLLRPSAPPPWAVPGAAPSAPLSLPASSRPSLHHDNTPLFHRLSASLLHASFMCLVFLFLFLETWLPKQLWKYGYITANF